MRCPTGNWTNLNSTCEVTTCLMYAKLITSNDEECYLKDFSSCSGNKNVTVTATSKTNKMQNTTTVATGKIKTIDDRTFPGSEKNAWLEWKDNPDEDYWDKGLWWKERYDSCYKKPAGCESEVSYKQQLLGCMSCPTGNWKTINSTCEVSKRTKWFKCVSPDDEECYLKDFSSCNGNKIGTSRDSENTNITPITATGNSTDIQFDNWEECFPNQHENQVKMRRVQLGCAPHIKSLYQVAECRENDEEKAETAASTGTADRETGNKGNERCYPSYLLFMLVVYSTLSTSSCCWIFVCGLKRRRKKKKKGDPEKMDYEHEYHSVKGEEIKII